MSLGLGACDDIGNENARGQARPDVAPPKLSQVELLPPDVDRSITARVEVRNPLAIAATQIDLQKQSDGIVDILWVIDDSGSMKNQRATLGANFSRFVDRLTELRVDFQIGVTSTNYNDSGQLRVGTPKVGDPTPPKIITNLNPDTTAKKVAAFVANTTFPESRTRWEQGLRMMQYALSPPAITGPNAGFLRPNAALAVIVVSDEDDSSFGETAYYARWLRSVKGKGNENLISFSTIGGTTPDGCFPPGEEIYFGGMADPAFRYSAVSTKTGGVIGSICDRSFENTLVQIAEALNTLRRIFPLSLTPDSSTITVYVNGVEARQDVVNGWQYKADTNSIAFLGNFVPSPGATIKIVYAIQ